MDLIASYHAMTAAPGAEGVVDAATWSDLDLDAVFAHMDRNISGIGQQYLYHLLHTYEPDESKLQRRSSVVSIMSEDQHLRERIQLELLGVSGVSSYFIAYVVLGRQLPHTKYYWIFSVWSFLSVATIAMVWVNSAFLIGAIAVAITNIILNKLFSQKIYEYFAGFSGLNKLIVTALALGRIEPAEHIEELQVLKRYTGLLRSLKNTLGNFVIDRDSLPELAAIAIEYMNMFFLFDIVAYYRSVDTLLKHQQEMHEIFTTVAALDASIAIASYLVEHPVHAMPEFSAEGIGFDGLYHPLIPDPVPNSLELSTASMLITGSNMSGKTSFIKTVGVNVILAQTLYFCLARSITMPRLFVKTSIQRNENLKAGKSYFFVEIEALHAFMQLTDTTQKYLFLIDEIFRGTNTIERLASSTAVLNRLDEGNTVFVTTHDIELQDLLQGRYSIFHFSEQVEDGRFFFDHKIKRGPCTSGNAIKLLEIMEYPASTIAEARSIVRSLLQEDPPVL